MFTLTKVKLQEGRHSLVHEGKETTLPNAKLFDWETNESKKLESLNDIKEGWQIVLYSLTDHHRTSKIKKIIEYTNKKVVFETETSIYELVKAQEE